MRHDPVKQRCLLHSRIVCGLFVLLLNSQIYAKQVAMPANLPCAVAGACAGSMPIQDARLFRVTMINMSGKRREAVVRKALIDLPVAQRVSLQVHAGEIIRVTSDADSKIDTRFLVNKGDAGRLIAVP